MGAKSKLDPAEQERLEAKSEWDTKEREWEEAYTKMKQLREQLADALKQGNDTSTIRQLLEEAKERNREAEKLYEDAKERYQEAKKETQGQQIEEEWLFGVSAVAGAEAVPLTDINPSDYEPLSLESLRESVNSDVHLPLVSKILEDAGHSNPPNPVLMRQEYMEFLDAWLASRTGFMLTGSPGIGKSVCSYVALEYKLRESSSNVVAWMWDTVKGLWTYLRWGETIYYMPGSDWLTNKLCGSAPGNSTFVYDGRHNLHHMNLPPFSLGLAVHSPSAESFGGAEKAGFERWCMKAWTGEEVARWAEMQGANVDLALEIFDRLGGHIRDVAACLTRPSRERSLQRAENLVRSALRRMLPQRAREPSFAGAGLMGSVAHQVLHWGPTGHGLRWNRDASRRDLIWFFCSDFVRKEYVSWLNKNTRLKLLQEPPEVFSFEAAVLGHMEENKETRFKVRSLEGAGGGEFAVKELNWERWMVYNGIGDVPAGGLGPGVVYVPRSKTEPDVDAFWMDETEGLVFLQLQVILAAKHTVKGNRIGELMNRLHQSSAHLWFVKPARHGFERQAILPSENQEDAPENAPNVSQSVAYILTSGDCGE